MANPDILSQRYVTAPVNDIWSERGKTLAERDKDFFNNAA